MDERLDELDVGLDELDERRSKLRSPPPPPSHHLDNDEEGEMDELYVEQMSKLRSPPPPPPSQHQDEEGELEDDEIDNDLDVEIADIAEQKKLAMEDLDKNNDDEKSKSHLLHSASFYGYTGPICPQTPSKKANKEEKKEEEVEDGEWAGWEEEEEGEHLQTGPGGHGRLMERSDTKYCLIVSSDYRLTPRKIPLSPAASSFLVEEEEAEEEEVEWEIDEAFKEEESEELLKPSTDLILVNSQADSIEIKETNEGQIVPVEEKGNSEKILSEDECDSSSASGGEEEEESKEKANSNGPKKNQTEHRLVVKKDKMARGILMMIPLETIRKRRKQQAQQDCLEDILNYV